ncbi:MAG TPA: hypothetical protein IAB55_05575 [Candidatus Merdivicinus faecavium]|nr:hypothetical protein [Candidatus Merdivicinus faecavium]
MDQLEWCLQAYRELLGRNFVLTLEDGEILSISFQKEHFHHLLGLHKLIDLDLVNIKRNSAAKIYKSIEKNRIDENYLKKSVRFHMMEKRLQYFPLIRGMLNGQVIIDFDPTALDSTHLNAVEYILFQKVKDGYIHLAFGRQENRTVFPNTFFFEPGKRYITGQRILNITEVKVVNFLKRE